MPQTPRELLKSLRHLNTEPALKRLEQYVRSRMNPLPPQPKMVGWFGIRPGKPLLFTASPDQAEEWEKAGIQITPALVKHDVQTTARSD